jgi:predicted regulator of Ras-like GTPase activity (Roadblock/LC7/MglB family)
MVKKMTTHPPTTTVMVDGLPVTVTLDEDPAFAGLRSSLVQINKIPGVKGYILRNKTTAVIDLQNPPKLTDYARLASETTDACQEISELFGQTITKAVVEGKELKMLCMTVGGNRLSIFVEKNVDHADIFRQISP